MEEAMRNFLITGLGLAALVATGAAFAADVTTSVDEVSVSSSGQLLEGLTLTDRLADATNDAATGHDDDGDGDGDGTTPAADDTSDTGGDEKGCGCSSSANAGYGALAAFLPLGLVGLRRRQD
jgi:MYXO-CTERM domain-containing protein